MVWTDQADGSEENWKGRDSKDIKVDRTIH